MNQTMKKLFSVVSITLCATIGLSLPVEVYASTLPEKENNYSSFNNIVGENPEESKIVKELTGERTENSKEFLLEDGTKMIAQYNEPVHYKDSKGKWVEYNNTLSEDKTASPDEAGDSSYTNKSSDISVNLSNKAKSKNMISLQSNGYKISWGYDNAGKSKADVKKNNEKTSGNDKFTTLKNITTETLYKGVFNDVDLQYFVTTTGIKENIILKSSKAQNEFTLNYKIPNLTAKQKDDKTITLSNKDGKEIYTISAPYMYDANGSSSTQMKIEIVKQKGSNLQVKLTADYAFIHTIGRAFPVTIDPEITTTLKSDLTFYENANGSVNSYGPYYTSKNSYAICTVNNLPKLENGEEVISAKYSFETENGSKLFADEGENPIIVNAHKLTSASNGNVKYDSKVLDYDSLTYEDNRYLTFDLTSTFKGWYSDTNTKGFVIEALDTVGSKKVVFKSYTKTSTKPALTLIYKDFTGTESNLSYHTINVGTNAQAAVSNYLGNLVINQTLYEGTGSRMPLSITATYNSINKDTAFGNGPASGYGWQFSFNQYVREVTDKNLTKAGYNYIYTDADGTDHYLKLAEGETAKWEDEDGLGITLTKDENNIFIDNGSTTQTYESTADGGKLLSEKDKHKNTITYTYTDGDLTKITDGSGREVQLKYKSSTNGKKVVSRITKPDGTKIDIAYTTAKDKVTSISFNDGHTSRFEYDDNYNLISISGVSDSYMKSLPTHKFTYTNGKVTNITEYGTDGTEGNHLNISYKADNTTVFTDKQGHSETHIFDNSGSTVSVLNSNGYATSSENTGLVINNSANAYTKNYITESSQQTEVGGGKYYFVSNGAKGSTTSTGGKVTVDNSAATEEDGYYQYLGTTSLKVENPTSENNSAFFTGFAHQFKETTFNGKDVTFSAYVKTKNVKQIYSGGSVGAILKVKCLDSSGKTVKEINSIGLTGTLDWQRISVTANVPSTTASIRVYGLIRYASGTAWFDCIQFEEGNCANNFNALQNSDFSSNDNWLTEENKSISANKGTVTIGGTAGAFDDENADSSSDDSTDETQPSTYTKTVTETEPNDSITTYDDYGNAIKSEQGFVTRTVKKTYEVEENETTEEVTNPSDSDTDNSDDNDNSDTTDDNSLGNKYIYQNIKVGRAGVSFKINGTAKSNSVPLSNENRTFGIALNIYYNNSSTPEFHYQNFSADTDGYQQVSLSVTPEKTNEVVNYIAFAFVYAYNENEMTVDNAEVNISPLIQSSEDSKNETSEKEAVDEEVLSESIDKSKPYMQTSSEYDSTGNYVTSETNEQGSTTKYAYDANGNKTAVTDGNGNVTNYTYDTNGNVLSIKNGTSGNDYSYTGSGSVSKITHNGFSYSFNYDVFYNLVSTKIGNVAITSNTYDSNGNLAKTTYANGDYFEYTYDDYGNISVITGETGKIAEMIYNKQGLVTKAVDYSSGETSYYYYTFDGSLESEYRTSSDGSLTHYIITDSNGNTVEKTSVNGQTKTITTGTDKDGKSFVSNDGVTNETSTDDFGRTTQVRTVRSDGTLVFNTDYEYADGKAENSTTNLISKFSQSYGGDSVLSYDYSYDNNGNITEIKQNGKLINKYTYDSLNELKEEYDYVNKFYINYSYDGAGNLQNKYEQVLDPNYGYPTGTQHGNTYEYTDTSWKDKLTKVNGSNISYDENGNPLTYRDGMSFEWENGRILKKINTSDKSVQMSYDSNGMRTQKTVDGVKTNYYYDSNKNLIALVKGNDTLLFYYDSDGSATSFSYNGTMYFYVKNLQGDVIRIIDLAGTEVASYVYDSWGNIKDTKGEPTIREINPIRYRGYVYDTETSLYYLQSRYYDPLTGRFLNADEISYMFINDSVIGSNAFSYCDNNSINAVDSDGFKSKKKHFCVSSDFVSWGIDLIITFVCPGASIAYDAVGFSLKRIFRRLGTKKSLNFLLKSAIPKCKGMFSRFFTVIRTLIWRAAGITINWLQSKAVSKFFNQITKYAEKLKKNAGKAVMLITGLFSFGSFIATILDIVSDNNLNGKIRIW
ncbi:Cell wall-associated polypeptide CWBP200 [uncultured Ruminococcus sp.]|nr:RHS repeat-associated core domain-containing protein [uncultured Ruminococcus sp.]SCJ02563.1 Cell wall-associated polypeptide CWBP200 [uncultured Ruminococcus sp.]